MSLSEQMLWVAVETRVAFGMALRRSWSILRGCMSLQDLLVSLTLVGADNNLQAEAKLLEDIKRRQRN